MARFPVAEEADVGAVKAITVDVAHADTASGPIEPLVDRRGNGFLPRAGCAYRSWWPPPPPDRMRALGRSDRHREPQTRPRRVKDKMRSDSGQRGIRPLELARARYSTEVWDDRRSDTGNDLDEADDE